MITQLPLIVSLLLCLSTTHAFDYKIDLARCGVDMACFVKKSCVQTEVDKANEEADDAAKATAIATLAKSLVDFDDDPSALVDSKCDAVIQIKAFSDTQFLVIMSLEGIAAPDGLKIVQGSMTQLECKKDVAPSSDNPEFYPIKPAGTPTFQPTSTMCSFFVTTKAASIASIFATPAFSSEKPSFVLSSTVDDKLEYENQGKALWSAKAQCSGVITLFVTSDDYKLADIDISKSTIECPGQKEFTVKYKDNANADLFKKTKKLKCIEDRGNKKWQFDDGTTYIKQDKALEFMCIESKLCTTCTELGEVSGCAECTKPSDETVDECMVKKCPGNQWTLDGTTTMNSPEGVKCEKDTASATGTYGWIIHSTEAKKIEAASCLSVVDCPEPSNRICPEGKTCPPGGPVISKTTISCQEGTKLGYDGDPVSEVKCNRTSGTWDKLEDITKAVYCEKAGSETDTSPQTGGGGMSPGIIALIIVGVLFLIGGGVAFIVMKVVLPRRNKGKGGAGKGGTTSRKAGQKSSKKSSEKSKSKSGSGGKKSEGSDPPENKADGAKSTGEATPATPSTPAAVEGEKKGPPTTDIEGLKTDKDQAAPSDPNVPPTAGAPTPGAPTPGVPPPVPPPAGAVPV